MEDKELVYTWQVPDDITDFTGFDDIAQVYRVYFSNKAAGGCIVEAKFGNEEKWTPNPWSVRPLIRYMVELIRKQESSLDFYKIRIDQLQQWQKSLPEPYRTECCNILANGRKYP